MPQHSDRWTSRPPRHAPVCEMLTRISDAGLLGILFVAPFFMGGRHPLGRLVFVLCAVICAGAWVLRQAIVKQAKWRSTAAQWILVAAAALLVVQLVPLPTSLLASLTPHFETILPLWSASQQPGVYLGNWSQISVAPAETRAGLVILLAYGLTFLVAVQRMEKIEDVERQLTWLAAAAVVMGLFGLVQFFSSNGKFVWVYEHPFRSVNRVQGSFINKNHFAHLLALGLGPLVFWFVKKRCEGRRTNLGGFQPGADDDRHRQFVSFAVIIGIGIVLFSGLMSLSRGGALAIATALLVVCLVYYLSRLLDRPLFFALVAVASILGVSLVVHGYHQVSTRLDDFAALSVNELDQTGMRRAVWAANWRAFLTSPWLGHGVGTHREIYKIFMENRLPVEYTHAENGYLQVASETGIAGLALLVTAIGMCSYWCVAGFFFGRSKRLMACLGAAAAGLSASLVHSLVDFVWYIPATMSWTVLLAAAACRIYQLATSAPTTAPGRTERGPYAEANVEAGGLVLPRAAWVATAAIVLVLGAFLTVDRVGPAWASSKWDDYLKRSQELSKIDDAYRNQASAAERQDLDESREAIVTQMIDDLELHLHRQPSHARAHMRMAAVCLRRFHQRQRYGENPMNLSQIRDAALASKFASREALYEWLDRAIGSHRAYLDKALWHARRGLQLCPLQGDGYLYLADLCFLQGSKPQAKAAYVQQALLVRPYDGHVLFHAGKEAILAGDLEKAVEYWKRSYQSGQRHQEQIAGVLAGKIPVSFFLESFQPRLADWSVLIAQFAPVSAADDLRILCRYFLEQAQREPDVATAPKTTTTWLSIYRVSSTLGDQAGADDCLRRAMLCNTDDYRSRLEIARLLMDADRFDDAEGQLKWCLQRRPADKRARSGWEKLVRARAHQVQASVDGRQPDVLRR